MSAGVAYEVFADAVETPRWLPVVQSARVMARTPDGRPQRVSFTAKLERGSVGYTLGYSYDVKQLVVAWATDAQSALQLAGEARFMPLSPRACMLVYRLTVELPIVAEWSDTAYDGHPASAVVADFREHLKRMG